MNIAPRPPEQPEDTELLARLALDLAVEAGRLIVDERPVDLAVADTKATRTDIVTVMDRAAETLIRARLAAARPGDAVLGEEAGSTAATSSTGITWVVDPIDGTVNYLYDIPAYAVSVAAVVGDPTVPGAWRPVAGAVVNPAAGEVFHARVGHGAHRRRGEGPTTRLGPSGCADLGLALVGTGFGYAAQRRAAQADRLRTVLPRVRDIRRIGSAALDLCHVADGSLDAYFEWGLNAWDFAAGWLIASEAGARVGGPGDADPQTELTWACAPGLADDLTTLLDEAAAAAPGGPTPT